MFSRRELVRIILPLFFQAMLTILVGIADSVMVSVTGEAAVSGVSLSDSLMTFFLLFFSAFAAGGAVVVGQHLGAGQRNYAKNVAFQLVGFSFLCSIVVMVLLEATRSILISFLFGRIEPDVDQNAQVYMLIVVLSLPAISLFESGSAILRTTGNTRNTMILSIVMNVINVALNAVFIYAMQMGSRGAALATVISRYVAAIATMVMLHRPRYMLRLENLLRWRPDWAKIRQILKIGVPNGLENGMFQGGKLVLTSVVATFGTSSITANAIGLLESSLHAIPGTAVTLLLTMVVSRCVGAGKFNQARYYTRMLCVVGYIGITIFCILALWSLPLVEVAYGLSLETAALTDQVVLIHCIWMITLWGMSFCVPTSLRAAGDVRFPMIVSILSMWILRLGGGYILATFCGMGVIGIWVAYSFDWLARSVLFMIRWKKGTWMKFSVVQKNS